MKTSSIPEWTSYDLHLDHLRGIIRKHTAIWGHVPVPIPGVSGHRWDALDVELLSHLSERYQLQCLFLQSKEFELKSRLANLESALNRLREGSEKSKHSIDLSTFSKRLFRFSRKARNIRYILQSLVLFRTTNKSAYDELMREYSKYTNGSTSLHELMRKECWKDRKFDVDYAYLFDRLEKAQQIIDKEIAEVVEVAKAEDGRPFTSSSSGGERMVNGMHPHNEAEEIRPWTRASSTTTLQGYQSIGKMSTASSPTINAGYWSDSEHASDLEEVDTGSSWEAKEEAGCLSSCFSSITTAFSWVFGKRKIPSNSVDEYTRLLA